MSTAANDMQLESLPEDGEPRRTRPYERRIGPDEHLITLNEAADCLPRLDSKKVAISTLWRWCRMGLRGEFMEYVRVGRRICTTREALLRFFSDLADLDEQSPPPSKRIKGKRPITSRRRQRALAEADAVLERAGI